MSELLTPRPYLAVQNVTIEPDGVRSIWVRIATRTSGVLIKKIAAGESHQPLLPWLESAQLQLPTSYHHYNLAWGTGAGEHPTLYTLRHDTRNENIVNDHLIGPDYLQLWGDDTEGQYEGPDFIDFTGAPVLRSDVDLIGVYPAMLTPTLERGNRGGIHSHGVRK